MGFKLVKPSPALLLPGTFLRKFAFHDDNERQYVRQITKLARSNQTRIHLLASDDNSLYGFVALSTSLLLEKPCIVIDYLFTSTPYRGVTFSDLGKKVSEYLVDFAIVTATEINDKVPVRFVALLPAYHALVPFYKLRGFSTLDNSDWLFLRL